MSRSDFSTGSFAESGDLPVDQALLLDEACNAFEAKLRAGDKPDILTTLRELPAPLRTVALKELVQLDVFYRLENGHTPTVSDYLDPLPELDPHWLAGVIGGSKRIDASVKALVGVGQWTAELAPTLAGERFGGFEVIEEIARGGMGVVYRARQSNPDRVVALKVIRSGEFADRAEVRRFRQEVEAGATLDHPNIVSIFEVGESRGVQFYAMRLVEGGSLAERMAEWTVAKSPTRAEVRVRQRKVCELMAAAARAVNHAHQRFILHRDLKPGNILLDESGTPHVTDFGLARRIGKDSTLTRTGAILGTPSYMAPEQARGREDVTTEADVYGLGAVLYELLAGRPPFVGEDVLDTLYQVREREPVGPRSVCTWVDRDLETICMKCLEKDPNKRYVSAAALAEDLDRWSNGEPVLARRAGPVERVVKWVRRNPAGAGLVVLGGITVAAVIWGLVALSFNAELAEGKRRVEQANAELTVQRDEADRLRHVAVEQQKKAAEQEALARRYLYVTQMNQAQKAYEEKRFGHALGLLDKVRPERADQEDLRGPEWHHLWRLCGGSTIELRGHTAAITALTYSPDGSLIASGDAEGTVRVWDANRQREKLVFHVGDAAVNAVAFDPAGTRLAVASDDRTARVWDLDATREVCKFIGHVDVVLCVSFHPSGRWVVSGSRDGSVHLWNTNDAAGRQFLASGPAVAAVVITPDGKQVIAAREDGSIRLWDATTGQEKGRWNPPDWINDPGVTCVALSPDGSSLLLGRAIGDRKDPPRGTLEMWSVTGEILKTISTGTEPALSARFSSDGRTVVIGTVAANVLVLAATTLEESHRFQESSIGVSALDPDGRILVGGGHDRTVRIRPLKTEVKVEGKTVTGVAFHPKGRLVALAGDGMVIDAWTGQATPTRFAPAWNTWQYTRVRFSPDGMTFTEGHSAIDLPSSRTTPLPLSPDVKDSRPRGPLDVDFSPDGQLLALATSTDKSAWLYDLNPPRFRTRLSKPQHSQAGHPTPIKGSWATCVRFSPDGSTLALGFGNGPAGTGSGEVQLWDVATGTLRRVLDRRYYGVWALEYSRDGRYLSTACGNYTTTKGGGEVRIYDAHTGREVTTLGGFASCVFGLSFSPDGTRLAASCCDSSGGTARHVHIWDLVARQQVAVFEYSKNVRAVAYSPDGLRLVVGGDKGFGAEIWGPP